MDPRHELLRLSPGLSVVEGRTTSAAGMPSPRPQSLPPSFRRGGRLHQPNTARQSFPPWTCCSLRSKTTAVGGWTASAAGKPLRPSSARARSSRLQDAGALSPCSHSLNGCCPVSTKTTVVEGWRTASSAGMPLQPSAARARSSPHLGCWCSPCSHSHNGCCSVRSKTAVAGGWTAKFPFSNPHRRPVHAAPAP